LDDVQDRTDSFGYWLRRRRKALDLTQEALAQRVCCSGLTITKIEADERRPSRRLVERLTAALAIPEEARRDFLDAARALHGANRLHLEHAPFSSDAPASGSGVPIHSPPDSILGAASDTPLRRPT
jgi:transcriptional regulator with XRE-family HTH domain